MSFGPTELILILAIVVIIFGVGKLPQVGGALGQSIREFRKAQDDAVENQTAAPAQNVTEIRRTPDVSVESQKPATDRPVHES